MQLSISTAAISQARRWQQVLAAAKAFSLLCQLLPAICPKDVGNMMLFMEMQAVCNMLFTGGWSGHNVAGW
jgi:hypothetical protein